MMEMEMESVDYEMYVDCTPICGDMEWDPVLEAMQNAAFNQEDQEPIGASGDEVFVPEPVEAPPQGGPHQEIVADDQILQVGPVEPNPTDHHHHQQLEPSLVPLANQEDGEGGYLPPPVPDQQNQAQASPEVGSDHHQETDHDQALFPHVINHDYYCVGLEILAEVSVQSECSAMYQIPIPRRPRGRPRKNSTSRPRPVPGQQRRPRQRINLAQFRLPSGWREDRKIRQQGKSIGRVDKCYIEVKTGHRCRSRVELRDYIASRKHVKQQVGGDDNGNDSGDSGESASSQGGREDSNGTSDCGESASSSHDQ